ncbi:MAG: aminotransferase class V-fold PLP-dependent enzyme [Chloroflexi bacterium]|nr:MAG: aminotransferase class V-fold PLP-dependent enzyme [Chloroflexota bacterium]
MANEGHVSGSIYHGDHDHYRFLTDCYGLFAHANVIQRDMYPSATKLEGEIVAMTAHMLHGEAIATHHPADHACGVITSGGTESLVNPMLVYREWGRDKGITEPEVIIPRSAHVALQKAGHLLGIRVVQAPLRDDWLVDVAWVREQVNANTVAIVGSAGNYPHGLIDPIDELSGIALEHDLGLHVDACLGGFILPWGERLGYPVRTFDFRVPGVTSISADSHKYGYGLKGISVLLYRSDSLRRRQYFNFPEWPGGIYLSPGLAGSRSGGLVAAAWAALVSLGERGYLDAAARIFETAATIRAGIESIPELRIFGDPTFLVAFHSADLDIYHVNDSLIARGWRLNALQLPPGLHFCVTRPNTAAGVAEAFLADLRASVEYAKQPGLGTAKSGALYGLGASPSGNEALDILFTAAVDAMYEVAPEAD